MKIEKIETKPEEIPVATLTVTQKELDLIVTLMNECGGLHSDLPFELYQQLTAAGGSTSSWDLHPVDGVPSYSVVFYPQHKNEASTVGSTSTVQKW